jgi:hypothetical protein
MLKLPPVMNTSFSTPGARRARAVTACGPCSASRAWSGMGMTWQRWPMRAWMWAMSPTLQAPLTMTNRSPPRLTNIRSSMMPPSSLSSRP